MNSSGSLRTILTRGIIASILFSGQALAGNNILFVLDGSGSMWGQIEGEAKITSAQKVMSKLLADLPKDTGVGFMAYGHRKEKACDDIQVLSSVAKGNTTDLVKKINALQPKGMTPIADALKQSLDVLGKHKGDNNSVVLVSDGVETCEGDPCAAAKALADAGINARVHVVGFDVGEKERKALSCISTNGKGKYFSAANAAELTKAFAEVKKEVVKKPEPPPAPKYKTVFEDKFDGKDLAADWEVVNPDPDSFIVEQGNLLMVSSTASSLGSDKIPNLFLLKNKFPEGDWRMTARVKIDFQTGKEVFYMGLYRDKDAWLSGSIRGWADNSYGSSILVHAEKPAKGKKATSFQKAIMKVGCNVCDEARAWANFSKGASKDPVLLRMEKQGRSYVVSAKYDNPDPKNKWVVLEKLTMLRGIPNVAVGAYQVTNVTGETLMNLDSLIIEELLPQK